ncbi:hypothetical protein PRIPAC_79566 [Pristionchus pacificus]|uniref:Uncharacterized protein n=1 Tax=Pristionchus pacificus TaxID=54126 RepID=A0A2A6CL84_PRIPA|nr:hypothetical protein PRIPAC_79566 [Pristionchus pacificus]|eukprot:PDM78837.1 hypothetical protein PRIPAC_31416 [Pristionchus pacificus]
MAQLNNGLHHSDLLPPSRQPRPVLNADGSLLRSLPGVTEVVCIGDDIWRSVGPYVMCNAASP